MAENYVLDFELGLIESSITTVTRQIRRRQRNQYFLFRQGTP
jgi:hypothetical protein